jgi:MFS family permease
MVKKYTPSVMITLLSIMMFLQFFAWGAWFATAAAALDAAKLGAFIGQTYGCAPLAAIFAPLFLGLVADRYFASEKVMGALMLGSGLLMLLIPGAAKQVQDNNHYANLGVASDVEQEDLDKALAAMKKKQGDKDGPTEEDIELAAKSLAVLSDEGKRKAVDAKGRNLYWLILGAMLCYMPTLGLGNTIAFTHIPSQDQFPKIRVWGTIGWIAAGLVLGIMQWSATYNIFWMGAITSILLGVFCFALPNTPPPLKGKPMDMRSLFMVDAFRLFLDWNFAVFAICSTLICIPLAYYYGMTSTYLTQTGFAEAGATMTIGQMSEIVFMLLIPFFFRKLGVKWMIVVGMACWVIRYVLFAYGAPNQITWMLLLAVALHGICYDFFFVTGFMYTDKKAPESIRGQAQGLLVFLTQGIGMFIGYWVMGAGKFFGREVDLTIGDYGEQVTKSQDFTANLTEARGEVEAVDFLATFGRMFSRNLPDGLDNKLLTDTMNQWQNFWYFPAILAAAIMVIFTLTFWDTSREPENGSESPKDKGSDG